uniref:T-box domain-containing protein n=1 Tax=Caenorhabditis tropicalis TaxID=1561998 RepID=A0A1I7T605_9PELO
MNMIQVHAVSVPPDWTTTNGIKPVLATRTRLRMNPKFKFDVWEIEELKMYRMLIKLELLDNYKYKFNEDLGGFYRHSLDEPTEEQKKPVFVEHHKGLMTGRFWKTDFVSFDNLFITTRDKFRCGSFLAELKRAYKATLVIIGESGEMVTEFHDPLHKFVIVSKIENKMEKEDPNQDAVVF